MFRLLKPRIAGNRFALQSLRLASTARPEPEKVAASLINMFPGASTVAKTSTILLSTSVAAWLVSKEIYVLDAEFFEMLCLFGAYYILWTGGKEGAIAYFEERRNVFLLIRP
jgi:F-type H+-transporting ATPase subunit b